MQSTRQRSEIPAALGVALDHIGLHGLITERHNLLALRLVCHEFRSNEALNKRITTIKLRTPGDLGLLERMLTTPNPNPATGQDSDNSGVFRSVRKLIFGRSVVQHLYGFPPSFRSWQILGTLEMGLQFKTLKKVNSSLVSLASSPREVTPAWIAKERVSSIILGSPGLSRQIGFACLGNILLYTNVIHLSIWGVDAWDMNASMDRLQQLTALRALRHLSVGLYVTSDLQLKWFVESCKKLTQLSRLDLELEYNGGFRGLSFSKLENCLRASDLQFLKVCKIHNQDVERCILSKAEFKNQQLQECDFTFKIGICRDELEGCAQHADNQVLQLVEKFEAETHFQKANGISLDLQLPIACFLRQVEIDTSIFTGVKEIEVSLRHSRHITRQEAFDPMRAVFGPTFHNPSGTSLVAVKRLSLLHLVCVMVYGAFMWGDIPETDASALLRILPSLMPNLEDFSTNVIRASPECISELRLLSNLTRLSFFSHDRYPEALQGPVLDLSLLPTSLKELSLWARSFEPSSTPTLPHLTKIEVSGLHEREPGLSPFRHCCAPVRELTFAGNERAEVIAASFPLLEKLMFATDKGNLSPLSSLRYLRELEVVKTPKVREMVGLPSLTQIMKLKLCLQHKASNWLQVSKLTQLRKLGISMDRHVLCEGLIPGTAPNMQSLEEVKAAYQEHLCTLMPHTVVKIT